MKWISILIGLFAIILTVKPFIKNAHWFVRIGDFPRLQVLFLLVISLGFLVFVFDTGSLFDYVIGSSLIASSIYQIRSILPFTFLSRKEVQNARKSEKNDTNLSLLIFNLMMENENHQAVLDLIEKYDPDIVLLAEPNERWLENLSPLKSEYPEMVARTLENHYGMVLFSKFPLSETEIRFMIEDDIPSIHAIVMMPAGERISLHGVHPRPPVPEERGRAIERDGELLLLGKEVREEELPCIVAGDMNDAAWSYTTTRFKRISGLLDPRVGRGFFNTFHAKYPFFRVPLDHIFHSRHFRLIELERIKNACGSDHFPVFVNLSLEKDAVAEQDEPLPDAAEVEEAEEAIDSALAANNSLLLTF